MNATLSAVLAASEKITGKFTPAYLMYDYDGLNAAELADLARDYAATYSGSFDFMLEMQAKCRRWGLSNGQAAAVLNCAAAEARRQAQAEQPARIIERRPPAGRFTVEGETLRLEADEDAPAVLLIKRHTKGLYGMYWQTFAKIEESGALVTVKQPRREEARALDVLLDSDDPAEFGYIFAIETGNCWRCGRKLEVAASLLRGLGPVCAQIMAGQTPAAVIAEQRGQLALI